MNLAHQAEDCQAFADNFLLITLLPVFVSVVQSHGKKTQTSSEEVAMRIRGATDVTRFNCRNVIEKEAKGITTNGRNEKR